MEIERKRKWKNNNNDTPPNWIVEFNELDKKEIQEKEIIANENDGGRRKETKRKNNHIKSLLLNMEYSTLGDVCMRKLRDSLQASQVITNQDTHNNYPFRFTQSALFAWTKEKNRNAKSTRIPNGIIMVYGIEIGIG